jgi:hypothetical protein
LLISIVTINRRFKKICFIVSSHGMSYCKVKYAYARTFLVLCVFNGLY